MNHLLNSSRFSLIIFILFKFKHCNCQIKIDNCIAKLNDGKLIDLSSLVSKL